MLSVLVTHLVKLAVSRSFNLKDILGTGHTIPCVIFQMTLGEITEEYSIAADQISKA